MDPIIVNKAFAELDIPATWNDRNHDSRLDADELLATGPAPWEDPTRYINDQGVVSDPLYIQKGYVNDDGTLTAGLQRALDLIRDHAHAPDRVNHSVFRNYVAAIPDDANIRTIQQSFLDLDISFLKTDLHKTSPDTQRILLELSRMTNVLDLLDCGQTSGLGTTIPLISAWLWTSDDADHRLLRLLAFARSNSGTVCWNGGAVSGCDIMPKSFFESVVKGRTSDFDKIEKQHLYQLALHHLQRALALIKRLDPRSPNHDGWVAIFNLLRAEERHLQCKATDGCTQSFKEEVRNQWRHLPENAPITIYFYPGWGVSLGTDGSQERSFRLQSLGGRPVFDHIASQLSSDIHVPLFTAPYVVGIHSQHLVAGTKAERHNVIGGETDNGQRDQRIDINPYRASFIAWGKYIAPQLLNTPYSDNLYSGHTFEWLTTLHEMGHGVGIGHRLTPISRAIDDYYLKVQQLSTLTIRDLWNQYTSSQSDPVTSANLSQLLYDYHPAIQGELRERHFIDRTIKAEDIILDKTVGEIIGSSLLDAVSVVSREHLSSLRGNQLAAQFGNYMSFEELKANLFGQAILSYIPEKSTGDRFYLAPDEKKRIQTAFINGILTAFYYIQDMETNLDSRLIAGYVLHLFDILTIPDSDGKSALTYNEVTHMWDVDFDRLDAVYKREYKQVIETMLSGDKQKGLDYLNTLITPDAFTRTRFTEMVERINTIVKESGATVSAFPIPLVTWSSDIK